MSDFCIGKIIVECRLWLDISLNLFLVKMQWRKKLCRSFISNIGESAFTNKFAVHCTYELKVNGN